jgi:hypothetical protein
MAKGKGGGLGDLWGFWNEIMRERWGLVESQGTALRQGLGCWWWWSLGGSGVTRRSLATWGWGERGRINFNYF